VLGRGSPSKALRGGVPTRLLCQGNALPRRMTVEARVGMWKRHEVRVDGTPFQVRRLKGDWYAVDGPLPTLSGRVRYSAWKDVLRIERAEGLLEVHFGWWSAAFAWKGRTYRIRHSVWGRQRVYDGDRLVAEGRATFGGFRFDVLMEDLASVSRELAFGLALRAQIQTAMAVAVGAA